jgi:hypothetical protein
VSRALAVEKRITNDQYFTPPEVAIACVRALNIWPPLTILEPSVGGGAFLHAVHARWPKAYTLACDIDQELAAYSGADACLYGDFLDFVNIGRSVDLVVGNPPYRHALEHVEHALDLVREGGHVAFLLRLGFLESRRRAAFWKAHPLKELHVLCERPSFTGGGTDSAAYGFFVWQKGHTGPSTLHHIFPEA